MSGSLVPFTTNGGRTRLYLNPAHVAFIREEEGDVTFVAFATGSERDGGAMPSLLVDGSIEETARKLNLALD